MWTAGLVAVVLATGPIVFAPACPSPDGYLVYEGYVERVIDGDTVLGQVATHMMDASRLGVTTLTLKEERIRIEGIDAPKKGTPQGNAATLRLNELAGGHLMRFVTKHRRDRYGRIMGYLCVDGVDLGALLIEEGLVDPWTG